MKGLGRLIMGTLLGLVVVAATGCPFVKCEKRTSIPTTCWRCGKGQATDTDLWIHSCQYCGAPSF
jgi:hypothetical protein